MPHPKSLEAFALIALTSIDLGGQALDARIVPQSRTNPSGVLLYAKDKVEIAKIQSALDDRSLVGYRPLIIGFDPTPDNLDRLGKELFWQQTDTWTMYYMGQRVASGKELPNVEVLKSAFASANITNKIVSLRKFLARNPTNLSAQAELMKELHSHAYLKTVRALNIALRDPREAPTARWGTTLAPVRKDELSPEDDLNIWADLTEQFTKVFATDDWLAVLPNYFSVSYSENMALHSPSMKAIYKRNLPRVEKELEDRQTDLTLWKMWQSMAQAVDRRLLDFYPQFTNLPDGSNLIWPPITMAEWITEEARQLNDWQKIIDFKRPWWPGMQTSLSRVAPVGKMPEPDTEAFARQRNINWNQTILPLLEAFLNTKDFESANEIYFDISSRPALEHETRQAIEMAKKHKYEFPVPPPDYKAPDIQVESSMNDPIAGNSTRVRVQHNRLKDMARKGYLHLLVVDPSVTEDINSAPPTMPTNNSGQPSQYNNNQTSISSPGYQSQPSTQASNPTQPGIPPGMPYRAQLSAHIQSVLSQGELPEYRLSPYIMKPDDVLAMELIDQEGLSRNTFVWGIFDDEAKYYHGGNSMPTSDNIMDLLYTMRRKSYLATLRDFAKEKPDSVTAKIILLVELARLGNLRSPNARMGTDNLFDESEDQEIWGEYANIANSLIPRLAAHTMEFEITICFNLPFVKNSLQLQRLATRNIDSIENALEARPHSRELWQLWGTFSPYTQTRTLPSFIDALSPVPELQGFPPTFLYPGLIQHYRSLEAWTYIIGLVEPIWESYQKMADDGENIKHRLTQSLMQQYIGPLCSAYEKQGQDFKAEKIRETWAKAEGWSEAYTR